MNKRAIQTEMPFYIVFILYLSCATPLFPAMHTQSGNKIDTTQA